MVGVSVLGGARVVPKNLTITFSFFFFKNLLGCYMYYQDKAEMNGQIFWGCPKAQEAWVASKLHLLPLDVHIDYL